MKYNKVLVLFYSRTGITKKVALKLNELYGFEIEEIVDKKNRAGALNYALAGKDALKGNETEIGEIKKDASAYDLTIICTPVWASNMPPAIRTYINKFKSGIKDVAFICTQGASGAEKTFSKLEELVGKKSVSNLALLSKEVSKGEYEEKLKIFNS